MPARHAVYWAPPEGSALERLGAGWLGRDLFGRPAPRPTVPGFAAGALERLTAGPGHYGFHATLKPPFVLAEGCGPEALDEAAAAFAATWPAFTAPPLKVDVLGAFLCLRPDGPAPDLHRLAAACVESFDRFRAPPSPEEARRRRQAGLSANQERLLERWGYPYVMDEFRFHLTLTGPIRDHGRRAALAGWLSSWMAPALAAPLPVNEIALYHQPDRASPFTLRARFRLKE